LRPYWSYHLNVIRNPTRRDLVAGVAALLAVRRVEGAKSRITKSRISAITDESGRTQTEAIAFAKQHGLQWVELRTVPESKKEFALLSEPELKRYDTELAANKLKVSLLKTSLLKFPWPQLSPGDPDSEANNQRWARRKEDLGRAIVAAQILGVDKIRLFTGARVPNPESAYPKIVQTMEELIPLAENAKVRLLIENEPSQNIGTCAELKAIMDLLPSKSIGFNWDAQNALSLQETPWPGGYGQLPKARMLNAQIKAEGLSNGPGQINWRAVMEAMQRDGYPGEISLATETFDGTFEKANDSMREVMHIVGELA
jgi:sugar phosphate isomerase/epimerase